MNPVFVDIPYFIPFTFTSVDDDARLQSTVSIPYNVAIYGITIAASSAIQSSFYRANLQFIDYTTGDTLFDEPMSNWCIQSDARTYWKLPSKWFVQKNSKIVCTLDSADGVVATTYYITLLAHVVSADPNPGLQPFSYSFPISVGFQDNIGGTTTGQPFNQQVTGTLAKHMLHDFDIHAIVFNSQSQGLAFPIMSFQLSTQNRKLFDRALIAGVAGGGSVYGQGDTIRWMAGSAFSPYGFPADSILQWKLPKPERVFKGELVRVDVAPAPTYIATDPIHNLFDEVTCFAVIGNHVDG